jgi:hypothetical protein
MAHDGTEQVGNWVVESCVETVAPEIQLTGSDFGYARFRDSMIAGKVFYVIVAGDDREAGIGTFDGTDRITRSEVRATLVNGAYSEGVGLPPITLPAGVDLTCASTFNTSSWEEIWGHVFTTGNPHGTTAAEVSVDDTGWTNIPASSTVQEAFDNIDSEIIRYSTFISLTDTPSTYSGNAGSLVYVNSGGTGLEFRASGDISQPLITRFTSNATTDLEPDVGSAWNRRSARPGRRWPTIGC